MSTPLQPDHRRTATAAVPAGRPGLRRREFLRYAGAAGAALALPAAAAGCRSEGGEGGGDGGGGTGRAIKIGYVSPQTGPLAGFGEADGYVVDAVKAKLGAGLMVGGTAYPIEVVAKTPLVGGQWKKGTAFTYEMVIVSNSAAPEIPTGGKLDPLGGV